MYILTVAYGRPSDPTKFDHYYAEIHRPLAEELPGLRELHDRKCVALGGNPAPYYRIAELSFSTADDLHAALASTAGQAAAADTANFADGGVTLFVQHD